MRMSLFCILTRTDQSHEYVEEIVKNVNPMDLDPFVSGLSEPVRGEHDVAVVSTEALFKISQDMTMVLD